MNNHLSYVARLNSISQTAGHGEVAHETADGGDEGGEGDEEVGGRDEGVRGRAEVCRPTAGKAATGQSDLRRAAKAQQATLSGTQQHRQHIM